MNENSSPVMENMISDTVITKYCGISHSIWTVLAGVTSYNVTDCKKEKRNIIQKRI